MGVKTWEWKQGDDPFESAVSLAEFLKLKPEELDRLMVQLAFDFPPEPENPFD